MKLDFRQTFVRLVYLLEGVFAKNDNKCPYCASEDFTVVFKKKHIIDICHCVNCSLYWTNPIFKFWNFYGPLYRGAGLTTVSPQTSELEKLKSTCFKGTDKDFSQIIGWFEKLSSGRRLLEFGSSWGYFLFQAKTQGFMPKGVEISDNRREFGIKNLGVDIRRSLDELLSAGERFDLIFSSHVLEHLTKLDDIFDKFFELLDKDGMLVVEVPHFNLARGKEIFGIMGAVHPLGFCKEFFIKNLPKHGFEVAVHMGYKDLIESYHGKKGDILVVMCRKKMQ